jgi:hypothetical protein
MILKPATEEFTTVNRVFLADEYRSKVKEILMLDIVAQN